MVGSAAGQSANLRQRLLTVSGVLAWVGIAGAVVTPHFVPFFLVGSCCLVLFWVWWDAVPDGSAQPSPRFIGPRFIGPGFIALLTLSAYVVVNAQWSMAPRSAIWIGLRLGGFALITAIVLASLPRLAPDVMRRLTFASAAGLILSVCLTTIEVFSGNLLRRLLSTFLPGFRPNAHHIRLEDGWVADINAYMSNRNVAAFMLLAWGGLLASALWVRWGRNVANPRHRQIIRWGLMAAGTVAILASEHESSKLALLVSAMVFALATYRPGLVVPVLTAGWLAAALLPVPLALALHQHAGLHEARLLPMSARHRVVIWGVTAERTLQKPLLGIGVGSTRVLADQALARGTLETTRSGGFRADADVHAHNIFLQVWFELGAVGALLLALVGVFLIRAIGAIPADVRPYAAAAFVATTTMATFSYSATAAWFVASFAFEAQLVGCGLVLAAGQGQPE